MYDIRSKKGTAIENKNYNLRSGTTGMTRWSSRSNKYVCDKRNATNTSNVTIHPFSLHCD